MSAIANLEQVLLTGNLQDLTPDQRVSYYQKVCTSLDLNPLTKPFDYITLNGKLKLYATKDCTDQLRKRDKVSIRIVSRDVIEGVYVVGVEASTPDGRTDASTGAVPIDTMKGEARANAMMKAETKGKRRVTLSICGLGMLDESEVDSIPRERATPSKAITNGERINQETGEVTMEERPDAVLVEERLTLMRECRNRSEFEDWAKATALPAVAAKLTDEGKEWIKQEAAAFWKTLPVARTVKPAPAPERKREPGEDDDRYDAANAGLQSNGEPIPF